MGSSKKHKEKRDRKKHKRDRSRSREQDSHSKKKLSESDSSSRSSSKRKREDPDFSNEDSLEKFAEQMLEEHIGPSRSSSDIRIKKEYSDSASTSKGHVESLSIADANKFRTKLGLKPLEIKKEKSGNAEEKVDIQAQNKLRLKLGLKLLEDSIKQEPSDSAKVPENSHSKKRVLESKPSFDDEEEETGEHHESLSIEETNKLRAKLGLKPLSIGNDTAESAISKQAEEVFVKTENIREKKKSEDLREKLRVMKEKRAIEEKLRKAKGVADSDSEDESASSWVLKHQKLQEEKDRAQKRAKMLEEMDAEFGIGALVDEEFDKKKAYTGKSLKGMTVAHAVDSIKEGHQVILTLKDKGVLDEDDDVLENVNIVDSERYAKNVENKIKKPDYKPYDEPEYDEFGILKKKNMLSKYDEEIEGEKKKTFKIGNENNASYITKEKELELIRMKLKQQNEVSLEMPEMRIANEYYTTQDMVQFKKPRKRRKVPKSTPFKADDLQPDVDERDFGSRRKSRQRVFDEDDVFPEESKTEKIPFIEDNQVLILEPPPPVVDQTELDGALHKAKKLKQRILMASASEKVLELMECSDGGKYVKGSAVNIELNSVAEFCRTLGDIPTYGLSGNRDEEADDMKDLERELLEEREKQELEAEDIQGTWNEVDIEEKPAEISMRENEPILEEEPDISLGVAGALKLATKKGYLGKDDTKYATGTGASSLQAKSYTIEEKFYEDDKFGKRDRYTGPVQDFKEKSHYKPDVKLEYIDDSGRILTAKEAFRYLSHKFHGKGPGKNKVDKRMKKLDQDTRLKQMSSTDTPLNTVKLLQQKQKETQSPYIVLSGGNKTLTQTMISKTKPV